MRWIGSFSWVMIMIVLTGLNGCSTPDSPGLPPVGDTGEAGHSASSERELAEQQAALITGNAGTAQGEDPAPLAPAKKDETIEVGDGLHIQVWLRDKSSQLDQYPFDGSVGVNGNVFLPHVGTIHVQGLSSAELQARLQRDFEEILQQPQIILDVKHREEKSTLQLRADGTVKSLRGKGKYVVLMGRIRRPGIYALEPGTRLRAAVAMAGGLAQPYAHPNIYLVRGDRDNPEVMRVNMRDILLGRDLSSNVELRPHDAVYVATKQLWKISDFITTVLSPVVATRDVLWLYDRFGEND